MNKVCVLGSINMDLVVRVKDIPRLGETILSQSFEKIPGGKGANQAIAAKRSGAEVCMIGKVGNDENGLILKAKLKEDNINVDYVFEDNIESTGMAYIMVNDSGNNSIIVTAGANKAIKEGEVEKAIGAINNSDILIAQFETSENMTLKAFKEAKRLGKLTILNPAPAKDIDDELFKYTDIIIPNETEAETLTGITVNCIDTAKNAAKVFLDKGVKFAIITLGDKGAVVIGDGFAEIVPAFKVKAIDTTAAGDSFIGALSSKLDFNNLNKESLIEAVKFGNKVSSIAVQKKGAQPSIPFLDEVLEVYFEE